jgi:hypothetical protein
VSPLDQTASLRLNLGVFGQDQWTINRLTLTMGLRYEYVNAYAPALQRDAGPLQDATSFPEVECLPCWHDLYPRLGVAYDLFGDRKTAVKASIGRYGAGSTTLLAETFRPVTAAVNSTTRAWTDANGNFYPDCDLRNPLASGECQPMQNQNFGQLQVRTRPDSNWISGLGKRGYNWQASASVDQQLWPGAAVSVGYFRTWFGNFAVIDNLAVTPADFDPYCITAPTDPRLPSHISGQQVCGFYDIKPEKFGVVDNIITLAKNYGNWTEYYNGVDVTFNVRLPRGGQIAGGWNVGNSVSLFQGTGFVSDKRNRCFVVDSPQELYNCETANPYQHRIKLNGSYLLPWGLQAAAVFQTLPGAPYGGAAQATITSAAVTPTGFGGGATYTLTTQQIAQSLGRNLAGGTRTVTLDLLPSYGFFIDQRVNQLDLRLSKIFRAGTARIQGNLDLYNALNASTVLLVNQQIGSTLPWLQPTQIMSARLFKFGIQLDF